jgi:hypothetical protein
VIPLLTEISARPLFLVECYWPGVTPAGLAAADGRIRRVVGQAAGIRYVGSVLVPADELVFRFFVGGSEAAVAAVNRCAAVLFDRVVAAVGYDGTSGTAPVDVPSNG